MEEYLAWAQQNLRSTPYAPTVVFDDMLVGQTVPRTSMARTVQFVVAQR